MPDQPEDHSEPAPDAKRKFRGSFAEDANPPEADWVILRTLSPAEAESLRDLLDAAGIPCEIREEPPATDVNLYVLEEDLEVAQDVASGADDEPEHHDAEDPADRDQRKLRDWICPNCDEQKLELLPLSKRWYHLATVFVSILLAPLLLSFVLWAITNPELATTIDRKTAGLKWPWILSLVILGWTLLAPHREKRCKSCGWDSRSTNQSTN